MTFLWLYWTTFWDGEVRTHGSCVGASPEASNFRWVRGCSVTQSLYENHRSCIKTQPELCVWISQRDLYLYILCVQTLYQHVHSSVCVCCLCWPQNSCWLRSPQVIFGSCRVEWQHSAINTVNQLKKKEKVIGADMLWNDTFTSPQTAESNKTML